MFLICFIFQMPFLLESQERDALTPGFYWGINVFFLLVFQDQVLYVHSVNTWLSV
jgi:hypothetical protein